jgi:hypothetical protein
MKRSRAGIINATVQSKTTESQPSLRAAAKQSTTTSQNNPANPARIYRTAGRFRFLMRKPLRTEQCYLDRHAGTNGQRSYLIQYSRRSQCLKKWLLKGNLQYIAYTIVGQRKRKAIPLKAETL